MEHITSRKNKALTRLKKLGADAEFRRQTGEFVCDGLTTLRDALAAGAEITAVLWGETAAMVIPELAEQHTCPRDVLESVSPLKSSKGPVFSVKMPPADYGAEIGCAVALESVQDPGNVGTVIRTADALGIDAVILIGDCADLYAPKTVRATMGAVFRQRTLRLTADELKELAEKNSLKLCGAALSDSARDIRQTDLKSAIVCIGSEGRGLSEELLSLCGEQVIIPIAEKTDSLNASVAAAIIMWEMTR